MPDLETRFRRLNEMRGPDLWPDIETRRPRTMPDGGTGRRVAAAVVALALAAGGAVLVVRAFVGGDRPVERPVRPAESPPAAVEPVVDVTLPIAWPSSVVYGDGSIWVASSANDGTGAGTLYRIDPDTAEILAQIEVPSIPAWEVGGGGMAVADGSVWIAGYLDDGDRPAVLRIDTSTDSLAEVIPLGGQFAGDVAVDEQGIWVTVFAEPSVELVRLDRETHSVEMRSSLGTDWARELLVVNGRPWIRVSQDTLAEIDPSSGAVITQVEVPGGVTSVTTSGGYLWAATWKSGPGYLLARIDPGTGRMDLFPSDSIGHLVESGPSGLWGRWDPGGGTLGVGRFDPASGEADALAVLERGIDVIAMAVASHSVWVAGYEEGVTRVELRPA